MINAYFQKKKLFIHIVATELSWTLRRLLSMFKIRSDFLFLFSLSPLTLSTSLKDTKIKFNK